MFNIFKKKSNGKMKSTTMIEASRKDPVMRASPIDKLTQLYQDLEDNKLPKISEPTDEEINECNLRREEFIAHLYTRLHQSPNHMGTAEKTIEMAKSNREIPTEVEIWVEKMINKYMENTTPMLGLVHCVDSAKKKLYAYRGYNWYSASELYPNVTFD